MKIKHTFVILAVLVSCAISLHALAYEFEVDTSGGGHVMKWTEINKAVATAAQPFFKYWTCRDPVGNFQCARLTEDGREGLFCRCNSVMNECDMVYSGQELKSVSCDVTEYVTSGVAFEWGAFIGPFPLPPPNDRFYLTLTHATVLPSAVTNWLTANGDFDEDGVEGADDACPEIAGTAANAGCPADDADHDGIADDPDNDGIPTLDESGAPLDNCPDKYNPGQDDKDNDGKGNVCDPDEAAASPGGPANSNPAGGAAGAAGSNGMGVMSSGEGCALAGAVAANPLAFILIGISLAPLAWRRRK